MSDEFTLEKLKISERLTVLETKHETDSVLIRDIHTAIVGNNGTRGLNTRVALLEQDKSVRDKHLFAVYTGIAGLALKTFWGNLFK